MRVKLTVAYDGTAYVGWQSQVNGVAVQDVLNEAVSDLCGTPVKTLGASRTDTGVHAEGNVAVFDADLYMDPSKIAFALNSRLPEDIRIVRSRQVADDFHPRFQKTVKTYEYHILNRTHPDPVGRLYEYHVYGSLDDREMDKAARFLIGEQDFAAFCAAGSSAKTTVRTIYDAKVRRQGDRVIFSVTGNGFLYNMVRILAGTLIYIGQGRMPAEAMKTIIEGRSRKNAGPTAPARGLVLKKIVYPEEDGRIREELRRLSEEKYRDFKAALIPNIDRKWILGVRVPLLRKYAAKIQGSEEAGLFLKEMPHAYLEEMDLAMLLMGSLRDFEEAVSCLDRLLPFVDNWETCDFPPPAVFGERPEALLPFIETWLSSPLPYPVRYAIGLLMRYFLEERYRGAYPEMVAAVTGENYYVRMMQAWYFAEGLCRRYEDFLPFIENRRLEARTHNKAIQKAVESLRMPSERKAYLRSLKIRKNSSKKASVEQDSQVGREDK